MGGGGLEVEGKEEEEEEAAELIERNRMDHVERVVHHCFTGLVKEYLVEGRAPSYGFHRLRNEKGRVSSRWGPSYIDDIEFV